MNAQYQSINFTADQKLIDFIQKKLDKLEVFHDDIVRGEVFLKVSKASNKENKLVEFKVHVPGRELVAKKQARSFEQAADRSAEALRRMLNKRKTKLSSVAS